MYSKLNKEEDICSLNLCKYQHAASTPRFTKKQLHTFLVLFIEEYLQREPYHRVQGVKRGSRFHRIVFLRFGKMGCGSHLF